MKISQSIQDCLLKIVENQQYVKDILDSIFKKGGKVLLVGGAVRDLLLKKKIEDLDFEVYGLSIEELENILESFGPVSFFGKSFGVLRLHALNVDWSLPRLDSSGRHPKVEYDPYMSFEKAFARRDVTINAMGIDMHSFEIIDPYNGQNDLKNKLLKSPDLDFFVQDPLRLLRVMQFVGRFDMQVDSNLTSFCKTMDMSDVSLERVEQEFIKLFLKSKYPSQGLKWLCEIDRFHEFLPGIDPNNNLWTTIDRAAAQNYDNDEEKLLIIWAVVSSFLLKEETVFTRPTTTHKKTVVYFMKRFTRKRLLIDGVALLTYFSNIKESFNDNQIKWIALWLAPHLSIYLLTRVIAIIKSDKIADQLLVQAKKQGVDRHPEVPILTGKDFLNVTEGKLIGELLKKAYELQINDSIRDKDRLKQLVSDLFVLQEKL